MDDEQKPELRMYLVVRGDIDLPTGKGYGQAGHAFSTALWQARDSYLPDGTSVISQYYADNQPKIVVKCKNLDALNRAEAECEAAGLTCFTVTDAGRTVFPEPTRTCMAIGPCYRDDLPKYIQT